jgi:molybdopterin/thiamine biosynthesis adenylyltransferase
MKIPPLVEPGRALTVDEVRRYSRHLIIPDLAMAGQARLMNAKVLCVGAGGLGSPALMYLAAAGVGTIGIAEFDTVDESNLQRQIIHGQSDIGKSKAKSAQEKISEINPYVNVVLHETRLDISNVMEIFSQYDIIVDGTDNFATRYLVNDACVLLKKPLSTALMDKPVCSGPSMALAIAAYIQNHHHQEWFLAVPKAAY